VTSPTIESLEKLIGTPRDGALLRYSLGNEWLKAGDAAAAAAQLREAVIRDPAYSAAWRLLGRALAATGDQAQALEAWRKGIRHSKRRPWRPGARASRRRGPGATSRPRRR